MPAAPALERLQTIIYDLNDPVILANQHGLFLNRSACRLHQLSDTELSRKPFDYFAGRLRQEDLQGNPLNLNQWPVYRAGQGELFSDQRVRVRRNESTPPWIACYSSRPILDRRGRRLVSVVHVRDVSSDNQGGEEVRRAWSSIRELSGRLLRLQDEERRRIARELHDGTVQVLSGLAMNLSLLGKSPLLEANQREMRLVNDSLQLAKQCLKELRALSHLLHPPILDELGLHSALRSWLDGFGERTGILVEAELSDPGRLPPEMETTLFRIVQEALANVHRHSGSPTVKIRLKHSQTDIRLEIEDAGRGLPRNVMQSARDEVRRIGVGIQGMRERARQLGGSLEIRCTGQGTMVSVTLPLQTS